MKKTILTIIGLALASTAWSAQTAVTPITATQDKIGALKASVNTKLGTVESNRQDHETRVAAMEAGKAGVDCFASEAAFNACFALDWQAINSSGFDGNLTATDDTLQEIAQRVDDLVLGSGSVDLSAYLSKTNTTSFTPSGDYHPATKKYVDDSITWPEAGVVVSTGSAAGTSLTVGGDAVGELVQMQSDGSGGMQLPFELRLADIADPTGILTGKVNASCLASESAFNACNLGLTWATGGYTNLTEFIGQTTWRVFYSDGSGDVKELAIGASGTVLKSNGASAAPSFQADATAAGAGYVSTPPTYSDEACTAGQYARAVGYRFDCLADGTGWDRTATTTWSNPTPATPTLSAIVIDTDGETLTMTGSASLSVGTGGNGGFDVDCVTGGNGITATYASGAPGSNLVYALGTTVNSGDTCDLDYTPPGNGIEATTGGADLASITSGAITNNSTQSSSVTAISGCVGISAAGSGGSVEVLVYNSAGSLLAYTSSLSAAGGTVCGNLNTPVASTAGDLYLAVREINDSGYPRYRMLAGTAGLNRVAAQTTRPSSMPAGENMDGYGFTDLVLYLRDSGNTQVLGNSNSDADTVTNPSQLWRKRTTYAW